MNPPMNMKALRCLGQSFSGTPQVVLNDGGRATCLSSPNKLSSCIADLRSAAGAQVIGLSSSK